MSFTPIKFGIFLAITCYLSHCLRRTPVNLKWVRSLCLYISYAPVDPDATVLSFRSLFHVSPEKGK